MWRAYPRLIYGQLDCLAATVHDRNITKNFRSPTLPTNDLDCFLSRFIEPGFRADHRDGKKKAEIDNSREREEMESIFGGQFSRFNRTHQSRGSEITGCNLDKTAGAEHSTPNSPSKTRLDSRLTLFFFSGLFNFFFVSPGRLG